MKETQKSTSFANSSKTLGQSEDMRLHRDRRDMCANPPLSSRTPTKTDASDGSASTSKISRIGHRRCYRRPRSASLRSATLALLVAVACYGSKAGGTGAAPGPARLTLRVRMPDGGLKRVQATAQDTVEGIMSKIGMGYDGEGLSTEAGGATADRSESVAGLGLGNGDFLFVKSNAAAHAAAKARASSVTRIKAAALGAKGRTNEFVPFPDLARPPPPRSTKRVKTWRDIEAMQAQTFSLKPQKESNVQKVSVEQAAMDDFVGYLKKTGLTEHRYALLFGRINPATKSIKVEAMFEPPQATTEGGYDPSALSETASSAKGAADALKAGGGQLTETCAPTSAAADEIARALRVANMLGLRLVGWCLSHDKREHFMAAMDVVTAAAVQLMSMIDRGLEEGVLVATVTVPVNRNDGEIATEAFSVSNQTVQMFSEGVLGGNQPSPNADRVTTTVPVREDGKDTKTPETVGLVCNVAIVQHEGVLQTRFPAANRGQPASISDLRACLFDAVPTPGSTSSSKNKKQPSFLKRVSDFQLLVFLSRQMGFSRDFEDLCAVVRKRGAKSPVLGKLKVVLENLCDVSDA